jgi:ferric-dicitrate binding protein FerR (iron transport regulator)
MTNFNNDIREIIRKYISGNYTAEELDRLLTYIQQDKHIDFDEQSAEVWDRLTEQDHPVSAKERLLYELEASRITRRPDKPAKIRKRHLWGDYRYIAAVGILLIGISSALFWLWQEWNSPQIPDVAYLSANVERGDKREMLLDDGSSVFLNSESLLVYPEYFDKTREVELEGEAFFSVTPDSTRSFTVKTSAIRVRVLGTSFNIKNYTSDPFMVVTVATGKVMVDLGNNMIRLMPNEQLYIDKQTGEFEKRMVQAGKYAQWRTGMLFFNRTPLTEVIETLERWYDTEIHLSGNYPVLISGEHDNKSLTAVLEAICFTSGMKYKKVSDGFLLYK